MINIGCHGTLISIVIDLHRFLFNLIQLIIQISFWFKFWWGYFSFWILSRWDYLSFWTLLWWGYFSFWVLLRWDYFSFWVLLWWDYFSFWVDLWWTYINIGLDWHLWSGHEFFFLLASDWFLTKFNISSCWPLLSKSAFEWFDNNFHIVLNWNNARVMLIFDWLLSKCIRLILYLVLGLYWSRYWIFICVFRYWLHHFLISLIFFLRCNQITMDQLIIEFEALFTVHERVTLISEWRLLLFHVSHRSICLWFKLDVAIWWDLLLIDQLDRCLHIILV